MTPAVTRVVPAPEYRLVLEFSNGETGILDVGPWLDFGVFKQLRDPEAFRKVRVAWDTVLWECGADLDPEFVYERCKRASPDA
jgi:hypothetical protein